MRGVGSIIRRLPLLFRRWQLDVLDSRLDRGESQIYYDFMIYFLWYGEGTILNPTATIS